MKRNILFILGAIAILLVLWFFSSEEVIRIPADEQHRAVLEENGCLDCHAEDRDHPLKETHPPKFQCFRCHDRVKE